MPFQCDIVTQERTVFSGQVDYVGLPGVEGRMGILPHHSPLLTALGFGEVMVRSQGEEQYFAVGGGLAEVRPEKVTVLADAAERAGEIDLERAEAARRQAEEAMREGPKDAERYSQIEAALKRARIRLDVGTRRAGGLRRQRAMPAGLGEEEESH